MATMKKSPSSRRLPKGSTVGREQTKRRAARATVPVASPALAASAAPAGAAVARTEILQGKSKDVSARLEALGGKNVVAIAFQPEEELAAVALLKVVQDMLPYYARQYKEIKEKKFKSLVDALLPDATLTPQEVTEAEMRADAIWHILHNAEWLTGSEVGKRAGYSPTNFGAQPNRWKKKGKIFAISQQGVDLFPLYGLDSVFRPLPVVQKILKVFKGMKNDWGIAFWFGSANSFLGGQRPQDVLKSNPESVIEAAKDEAAGVLHG